ncbi:MAG: DUF1990 domain-containing protein [Isosphaeraceae bacterium]
MVKSSRIWSFRKPSLDVLRRIIESPAELPFTYGAVGSTAGTPPDGYVVDRTRVKLGEGEAVFRSAVSALKHWRQFDLGWVEVWPADSPIEPGRLVLVVGYAAGLWLHNLCRIIYVIDESDRFGFAYGTLPGHMASGEERFLIEWDHSDDSVWYDVLAFSRPHHFLTRVGYKLVRRLQKRFGRESSASMRRAVDGAAVS